MVRNPRSGSDSLAVDSNPPSKQPGERSSSAGAPPIRIGVLEGEPIRLAGLSTVFEEAPEAGKPQLISVVGKLDDLLADPELLYLVVDFNSSAEGMKTLEL